MGEVDYILISYASVLSESQDVQIVVLNRILPSQWFIVPD